MSERRSRLRTLYGAGPLHALLMVACFALLGYTVATLGVTALWDPSSWWQSILVWFVGAVVLHDFVLFPLYTVTDRILRGSVPAVASRTDRRVPVLNHVRIPALASGLTFLLFFPGIVEQGGGTYARATGQDQHPFLGRWLLLVAAVFVVSALVYAVRLLWSRNRSPSTLKQ